MDPTARAPHCPHWIACIHSHGHHHSATHCYRFSTAQLRCAPYLACRANKGHLVYSWQDGNERNHQNCKAGVIRLGLKDTCGVVDRIFGGSRTRLSRSSCPPPRGQVPKRQSTLAIKASRPAGAKQKRGRLPWPVLANVKALGFLWLDLYTAVCARPLWVV